MPKSRWGDAGTPTSWPQGSLLEIVNRLSAQPRISRLHLPGPEFRQGAFKYAAANDNAQHLLAYDAQSANPQVAATLRDGSRANLIQLISPN